jgi:glucosamine-6-phosphate deaminase
LPIHIEVLPDKATLGREAAKKASSILRQILAEKTKARMLAATGASQFELLSFLTKREQIDWSRVELFHLDEYVGIDADHPASFRRYLRERLVRPVKPAVFHEIRGDMEDPAAECERLAALLDAEPIDLALVGIGENGHLAFNDPPAEFDAPCSFLVVDLDEACRRQQVGEGWFEDLDQVPTQAISISIPAILKTHHVICSVPDLRKAPAVRDCLGSDRPIDPEHPASILKRHSNTWVYLDVDSASLSDDVA